MSNENEMIKSTSKDTLSKLDNDLRDARASSLKDRNNFTIKVNQLESERAEVEMRE